eukprot:3935479-Rhodomonas_salina.3
MPFAWQARVVCARTPSAVSVLPAYLSLGMLHDHGVVRVRVRVRVRVKVRVRVRVGQSQCRVRVNVKLESESETESESESVQPSHVAHLCAAMGSGVGVQSERHPRTRAAPGDRGQLLHARQAGIVCRKSPPRGRPLICRVECSSALLSLTTER